jgi:cell wall-associated NlpC family hydrolase
MSTFPSTENTPRGSLSKWLIGSAVIVTLLVAALLMLKPFSSDATSASATNGDKYEVTFDGDNFSGAGASHAVKTTPVALRDNEEKFASPEPAGATKHRIAEMPAASSTTAPAKGAQTSAELKKALKAQKLDAKSASGQSVQLAGDGSALAPIGAPAAVQSVIAAGNVIKNFPYIWGGGHGSFQARGYDCSGSISYAFKAANLVDTPLVAADFKTWGEPGPGKWISVYASEGHVFMFVGGLRFDTSFRDGPRGSRWQTNKRSLDGFTIRHPAGL